GRKAIIYNRLWRPIADGRMKARAPLTESVLEKAFGASRTIVRGVLEYMAAEGYLAVPPYQNAHVIAPAPVETAAALDLLGMAMRHIIGELADRSRRISAGHRKLIALHLEAQEKADKDGDPVAAHLLGIEFLILLAAIHGSALFTDQVARTVVLLTLSLQLYGTFPPPSFYTGFQAGIARALLAGRPREALAEVDAGLDQICGRLRLDGASFYEEGDLAKLLRMGG
ncbi:MAG: GntR family transcriptional regulator, partial [Novosphingobium sp.]|nr:GntR family transcriptional regulator [Novosphingobium sp.]